MKSKYTAVLNSNATVINYGLLTFDDDGIVVGGVNDGVPYEDLGTQLIHFSDSPLPEGQELFDLLIEKAGE